VSQFPVFLTLFFVPSQQPGMLFVSEQTFQPWYYRSIPHSLSFGISFFAHFIASFGGAKSFICYILYCNGNFAWSGVMFASIDFVFHPTLSENIRILENVHGSKKG
jgi:hypothetical protein